MYTISDILRDIDRGCMAHNMIENRFSYRIVYFVNEQGKSTKHYLDTSYNGLCKALENIIRNNLSLTNSVVISAVTIRKNGKCIQLLSRSYMFSLDEFFKRINGERSNDKYRYTTYEKYAAS